MEKTKSVDDSVQGLPYYTVSPSFKCSRHKSLWLCDVTVDGLLRWASNQIKYDLSCCTAVDLILKNVTDSYFLTVECPIPGVLIEHGPFHNKLMMRGHAQSPIEPSLTHPPTWEQNPELVIPFLSTMGPLFSVGIPYKTLREGQGALIHIPSPKEFISWQLTLTLTVLRSSGGRTIG
jgi:hypothetical protein